MAKKTTTATTRVFKSTTQKMHDLYKLNASEFLKNIAWQAGVVDYVPTTHAHFYHTVTSKGIAQTTSSHSGGHFHVMELVTPATQDSAAVYKCSPPVKYAHKRVNGAMQKITVPFNKDDQHTHEVEYLKSEVLVEPKTNMEAVKFIAQMEARMNPPPAPGIEG
jgi:hypothetical protein